MILLIILQFVSILVRFFVDFFPRPDVNLPATELICPGESVLLDATPANQELLDDAITTTEDIIQGIIDDPDSDIEDFDITIPELTHQWYFNGNLIEGATGPSHEPSEPGIYDVFGVLFGCASEGFMIESGIEDADAYAWFEVLFDEDDEIADFVLY